MSDDEDHSSIEDDFSASEDEWKPGKSHRQASEDESDDDDSDFEDDAPASRKREARSQLSTSNNQGKQTKKRKSTGTSLRTKLFNKYKPPPKTVRSQPSSSKPVEQKRPNTAQPEKRVSRVPAKKQTNPTDSDSSGDDYLVNPDELDLQSSFFDVKPSTSSNKTAEDAPPFFDCNAGMQLTDSEDGEDEIDDDDEDGDASERFKSTITSAEATTKTKPVDLAYLQDFAANVEKAKVQYKKEKERSLLASPDAKVDVSSLLAMGEGSATKTSSSASTAPTKKTKNPKRQTKKSSQAATADTDSDWEEVEGEGDLASTTQPSDALANGIQVLVDLPQRQRKDKKSVDVEASLKRQLNRIIKENQVYLHKVGLLCHIYHGLFLNKVANNINLMPLALKLLPSKNVYPSGQTEIKYFQSMATWFKTAVKILDDRMYPKMKIDPVVSLAVQMKHRHAVCKRDYILMFIILLRAMGMQCRLVVNLVPVPLRPAQSSLCSLKMKPAADDKEKKKKVVKKVDPTPKKEQKESLKSPPLSNEERQKLKMKMEIVESEIKKKKAKETLQSKPSFDEVLDMNVSPPRKEKKPAVKRKSAENSSKSDVKKADTKSPYFDEDGVKKSKRRKPEVASANSFDDQLLDISVKRKSAENPSKSEKKKSDTKSPYFDGSSEDGARKPRRRKPEVSSANSFDDQLPSVPVKGKSSENSTKSEKKKADTKSPFFDGSTEDGGKKSARRKPEVTSANSFDDQLPSISVNSNQIEQPVEKPVKKAKSTRSAAKTVKEKIVPDIVVVADEAQTINNRQTSSTQAKRSRSKSPKAYISTTFLQTKASKALISDVEPKDTKRSRSKSPTPSSGKKESKTVGVSPRKLRSKTKLTIPQLDGGDDLSQPRRKQKIQIKQSDSEDDFEPSLPKKSRAVEKLKKADRQVLSPDITSQDQSPTRTAKNAVNLWVEVYSELEAQWICVDLFKGKVNCVDLIRKSVTPSALNYVFAFNNDTTIKDVTPRYCAQWATAVRKSRVEQFWLDEAIREYVTTSRTQRDLTEDVDLRRIHLDKPMPATISEYKDHPLYALERHLLKFQAIYPPNAVTLGFVRGEPVYARECVHTLHSREIWLKSARVVKPGEQPYKIVKARPKWDKFTSTVIKDQPLEIFGYWQTQEYDPPTAENGIVPRNAYGNVELFKECMLPKKTVHLHLPGLNRICKKLGIDCVPAVIGFDFHQGACHPLFDGFVVCEEFAEKVTDAWDKEQQEAERKEQEKYEARVYGNWKKLIKGLLIREHLKIKYNF